MAEERGKIAGRYLPRRQRRRRYAWLTVLVLLAWDGLLLYMIVACLIEPVYGAAFVAVISFCMGNKT